MSVSSLSEDAAALVSLLQMCPVRVHIRLPTLTAFRAMEDGRPRHKQHALVHELAYLIAIR